MDENNRVQMKDLHTQIGYVDDEGRAVVEDVHSRTVGPDAGMASVIKVACSTLLTTNSKQSV